MQESQNLPPRAGALAGMRVIELSQIMAGPTCGMMLADLGADVIKVEKLEGGDDARSTETRKSMAFRCHSHAESQQAGNLAGSQASARQGRAAAPLRGADVITENFRKGTMEKLGLGYEDLRRENPGLIYCSVSGYGSTGPVCGQRRLRSDRAGILRLDEHHRRTWRTAAAHRQFGGGHQRGAAGGPRHPRGLPAQAAHGRGPARGDLAAGGQPAAAVLARGNGLFRIRVSPGPSGSAHVLTAPYQAFPTATSWIIIGGANEKNFGRALRRFWAIRADARPTLRAQQ